MYCGLRHKDTGDRFWRAALLATGLSLSCISLSAGVPGEPGGMEHSLGGDFSVFRVGIQYRIRNHSVLHSINTGLETSGIVFGRSEAPGGYLNYNCSFPLAQVQLDESEFTFYAGPGVDMARCWDPVHGQGLTFGPCLELRADFRMKARPLAFSLALRPVLGFHTYSTGEEGEYNMSISKSGLLSGLIPDIGICYRFGEPAPCGLSDGDIQEETEKGTLSERRFFFTAEAGYMTDFRLMSHFNYIAEEGYRVDVKDYALLYFTDAWISAGAGVRIGRHFDLSLKAGYRSIGSKDALVPVLLCPRVVFGEAGDRLRGLLHAEAGPAFRGSAGADRVATTGRLGGGLRIETGSRAKLEFLGGLNGTLWHPLPSDIVNIKEIRRNNEVLLGLNFGMAVVL